MMTDWIVPFFALWWFGLLVVCTRRSLPWIWRLSALALTLFYTLWYGPELQASLAQSWTVDPIQAALRALAGLWQLVPIALLLAWPYTLHRAARERTAEDGARARRAVCVFTLFYWLAWLAAARAGVELTAPGLRQILESTLELLGVGGSAAVDAWSELDLPQPATE